MLFCLHLRTSPQSINKNRLRICKEAIDKFHSNLKEELIELLKEIQMLKTLKRKNTKMMSDIKKKRQLLSFCVCFFLISNLPFNFLSFFLFGCVGSSLLCTGFRSCGSWAVECRLSSCGAQAQLLHSMWDLPRPGLEPMSPALAGRFLTTGPPGKPGNPFLKGRI